MMLTRAVAAVLFSTQVLTLPAQSATEPDWNAAGAAWWAHVQYLASDDLQGRLPGTPGFELATEYVVKQFQAIGLKPAGGAGYLQPIKFSSSRLDASASKVEITSDGKTIALKPGEEITLQSTCHRFRGRRCAADLYRLWIAVANQAHG